MIIEQFRENDWLCVYMDGSKIQDRAETRVYSKLFSQRRPASQYMSHFDAEIYAIYLTLENLRPTSLRGGSPDVSISAIQTITEKQYFETKIIIDIKD